MIGVLLGAQPSPPPARPTPPITVALVEAPPPPEIIPPPPEPKTLSPPAPAVVQPAPKPEPSRPPPRSPARPAKSPPQTSSLVAAEGEADEGETGPVGPSEAELAGAARAGSGRGEGCDMAGRLQAALRRDARVRAAVDQPTQALWVWNGDWVRHPGQEGRGLAAVREAILWEVGFAPEACRTERVRGLVLITLGDGPGAARLVLGANSWRWSDLLYTHSGGRRLRR